LIAQSHGQDGLANLAPPRAPEAELSAQEISATFAPKAGLLRRSHGTSNRRIWSGAARQTLEAQSASMEMMPAKISEVTGREGRVDVRTSTGAKGSLAEKSQIHEG